MHRLEHPDGDTIAAEVTEGSGPAIVWLPGYGADMQGSKASWLAAQCAIWSWRFVRFDYRGHGRSGGDAASQTLSRHLEDIRLVIDQLTSGPVILAGSSMGGWLALDYIKRDPAKVLAFLGVAVAPDFTTYLDNDPDEYVSPAFIEDAKAHLLGDAPIVFDGPVALLHGLADDVAFSDLSIRAADLLTTSDVTVTLVKDGDHSLSRPQDLTLTFQALTRLREQVMAAPL